MKKMFVVLVFLAACSPHSMEDFQREGESICRDITKELKKVQTREELVKSVPKLKLKFNKLVDLMIEARAFQQESEEVFDPMVPASDGSALLLAELKRVYKLEAGREIIEKTQKEALLRLDAFERKKLGAVKQ